MGVYFKGYEVAPWDITKSYPIGSVVKYDGREYLAKKDVPVGINIGMSDYWDFGDDERLDNLEEAVEELDATVQNLTLDDLGDVDMNTVEDGDVLVYDSKSEAFVNTPATSLIGGLSYSTEERKIGTWIDGKPLYGKVITGLNLTMAWNQEYRTEIAFANAPNNIDTLVSIDGYGVRENNKIHYDINVFGYQSDNWILSSSETGTINALLIQYTKTTD